MKRIGFVGDFGNRDRGFRVLGYRHFMRAVHTLLFLVAVVEVAILVLVTRSTHLAWPPARIVGSCLLLLVLTWVGLARYQLGRSFSVTPQARQLVTTGLYARFRNPIYLASPVLLIGLSLVLAQWWLLLLLIIIVPLQIQRARREASILRATFGAEYDSYRAQTWF